MDGLPSGGDASDADGAGKTILVVDDERCIRSVTVTILESLGFRALSAEDGAAALATVADASIDGVLLDLSMPNGGGAEVLDRLRAVDPALPVVVMSGHAEPETLRRLGGRRADGYLAKPFSPAGLEASLRAVLASR